MLALILGAMLMQADATAAPSAVKIGGGPSDAFWVRVPTQQEVAAAAPQRAIEANISGRAVITCTVGQDGGMQACLILEEAPAGFRLGAAALRMAAKFKLGTVTRDGKPTVGGHVTIPVTFGS